MLITCSLVLVCAYSLTTENIKSLSQGNIGTEYGTAPNCICNAVSCNEGVVFIVHDKGHVEKCQHKDR